MIKCAHISELYELTDVPGSFLISTVLLPEAQKDSGFATFHVLPAWKGISPVEVYLEFLPGISKLALN